MQWPLRLWCELLARALSLNPPSAPKRGQRCRPSLGFRAGNHRGAAPARQRAAPQRRHCWPPPTAAHWRYLRPWGFAAGTEQGGDNTHLPSPQPAALHSRQRGWDSRLVSLRLAPSYFYSAPCWGKKHKFGQTLTHKVDGGRLSESWGLGPVELKSHLLG